MANACLLYESLADDGEVSADTEATSMPASLVLSPHVRKRWRSTAATGYIVCDLGGTFSPDTFCLFGLTLGDAGTVRLRVSTGDATGAEGDSLDTGVLDASSAYFDPDYGAFVYPGAAAEGRYVRFDLADVDATYVEAGRLVVGIRTQLAANFTPGSTRGWLDPSRKAKTEGGQTLIQRRSKARMLDFGFDFVTEWATLVEPIDRRNGVTEDLLLIVDPESSNVARDSVWGLVSDLTPVGFTPVPDVYSKQYRIEERL